MKNFIFKNLSSKLMLNNINKQLNNFQVFTFARKNSNFPSTSNLNLNYDTEIKNNKNNQNSLEKKEKEKSFSIKNQKNQKNQNEKIEENPMNKNINLINEEVTVTIKPYFPNAVSEKEKSSTHIDSSKMNEGKKIKKTNEQSGMNSLEILKNKRIDKKKIAATRKASLFMQNIKRELPEDL